MASVRKREGSKLPWLVSYREDDGTQRYKQFTLKSDADAEALRIERLKQTGRLDTLNAGREIVRDYGYKFFAARKADLAPATATTLASVWNAHVHDSDLARMQLRAVRPSDVQAFKVALGAAGVGDGSIRKALGLLSQVFEAAALDGAVTFNPCAPVERPSGARLGTVRVIAPESVEAIRSKLSERDAAYVSVLAYAGLRPQELGALTRDSFGVRLRVEAACNPDGSLRPPKGKGQSRSVPICAALREDIEALGFDGRLFRGERGGEWNKSSWANWRDRRFMPAARKAGVVIEKPYALRHSIASLWFRAGHDVVTVAGWLGNSPAVLLREYLHVIAELDPDDRRTVDELIAAARQPAKKAKRQAA